MGTQPNHTMIDLRVVEVRPPRFLRIADCAGDLGCSRNHIRNLVKAGKVAAFQLDGLVLIAADQWDRYLNTAQAKE